MRTRADFETYLKIPCGVLKFYYIQVTRRAILKTWTRIEASSSLVVTLELAVCFMIFTGAPEQAVVLVC